MAQPALRAPAPRRQTDDVRSPEPAMAHQVVGHGSVPAGERPAGIHHEAGATAGRLDTDLAPDRLASARG